MSTALWAALLGSSGLLGFIGWYIKFKIKRKYEKQDEENKQLRLQEEAWRNSSEELELFKENAFGRYIYLLQNLYHEINDFLPILTANRIVILKSEDGGGVPVVGSRIYSTVLWEAYNPPLTSIKHKWQREEADKQYVDLLSGLFMDKSYYMTTANLEPGKLKNLYEASKIFQTDSHFLYASEKRFIYLAINHMKPVDTTSPEYQNHLRILLNRLIAILKEMNNIKEEMDERIKTI